MTATAVETRSLRGDLVFRFQENRVLADLLDQFLTLYEEASRERSAEVDPFLRLGGELCHLIARGDESDLDQLIKIVYEIRMQMCDRLDRQPLQVPMYANGVIWEKWKLEKVRLLWEGVSPFDEGELLEVGSPVKFMKQFINWYESLFASSIDTELLEAQRRLKELESSEPRGPFLLEEEVLRMTDMRAYREFDTLIRNEEEREFYTGLTKTVDAALKRFAIVDQATKESLQKIREAHEAKLLSEKESLDRELDEIRRMYQEIITDLRVRLKARDKEIEDLEARSSRLEGRASRAESEVRSLRAELCQERANNERNAAAASSGGGGGGCNVM